MGAKINLLNYSTNKQKQKVWVPAEADEKVDKELKRLEQMPPLSSEAVVSRHYIDWVLSFPWQKASKDTISLATSRKNTQSTSCWA